ncbi:UvrD-helicase domain-containing protein [Thalassomonas sp. M1454]|uniref:UvrD-helicase domain-containing protein n=1 Tax=Thalassomonas sp. M1454 TaxID=2594477 RepID=UPI00117FA245|nr:UvrD-helicase domain-containing protein [Thalassomonas sp. M1454]TRX53470.1 AAA family ATPase [Thalassomonas sp. M1454]
MLLEVSTLTKYWNKIIGKTISVELDSTQISVTKNGTLTQISLNDVSHIEVKEGWLSSQLVISIDDQPHIVLKGYSSTTLNEFTQQAIQHLIALLATSDRWHAFEQSLDMLKNREVYLSSSEWQPIADLHLLVTKFSRLGIRPEELTNPLQQQVFQRAQALSKQDVSELGRELHNQMVVPILLEKHSVFFDTVEKMPLTDKQRIACVTNDDHNLVIAGAGTGKTATLVGKAGFLVEAKIAKAENVLMLAFGNKAAAEMNERIKERIPTVGEEFQASTFHALGNEIVSNHISYKKTVTPFTDQRAKFTQFLDQCIEQKAEEDDQYKALLVHYFSSLGTPAKSQLDFETIDDYHEFLSSCRLVTLNGEWVKSVGELRVANYLALNGVKYEYEANYKHNTKSVARRQYQPDFYLPEADLYIEYVGLNKNFETAPFVNQAQYIEGLEWKRELHRSKRTNLVELYSYQLTDGSLYRNIRQVLLDYNVAVTKTPLDEIFKKLKRENQTQWQGFIELLQRFLGLYKEGGFTVESLLNDISPEVCDIERTKAFLNIFTPVLDRYQDHLEETDTIDFSDMIALAVDIIEQGKFFHSYSHILVDEFQDISSGRAKLLKALLASKPNMRLFAVGDDWQSIYRFNGADIALFTEFSKSFSPATAVPLDKTFRFNNKIHNVSSQFVMANPGQLKKTITTYAEVDTPALRLVDIKNDLPSHSILSIKEQKQYAYLHALQRTLNTFNRSAEQKSKRLSVLIIGRFRQENMIMLNGIDFDKHPFDNLDVNYVTAHASKGLEADYVVVLGVEVGSFPSSRENDELIDLVLPNKENFLYAEERRLFYVALTRAKHFVYVLFDSDQGSPFLTEIKKYGSKLVENLRAGSFARWDCPSCKSGTLKPLQTRANKTFYKCSLAPACEQTMNACKYCNSPMQTHVEGFRYCLGCGEVELGCLRCGIGTMVARLENDPNRETFYGCNRFRRGADDSCGENIKVAEFEQRYEVAKQMIMNKV